MLCEPIQGWRSVEVTERRTALDYAQLLKKLVDHYYPEAELITLVQDNTYKGMWIDWRFTTEDARIKLKRLYPSLIN